MSKTRLIVHVENDEAIDPAVVCRELLSTLNARYPDCEFKVEEAPKPGPVSACNDIFDLEPDIL